MPRDNRKYVVAVVDDDRRIVESLASLLDSAGYDARLYASAEKLLEHEAQIAELACLISDIDMPGMDGFALQQAARAAKPGLPVIFITGRSELAKIAEASSERPQGLFMKPFNGPDLLAAVSRVVEAFRPAR